MRTVATGAVVLVLDQVTKQVVQSAMWLGQSIPVVPGFFHLTYLRNPGAAFGLLPGQRWLFLTVSVLAIGLILYYSRRPDTQRGLTPYAMGLLLGGAAGNLVDRIRYGTVVDFLDFFWGRYHWPAFNLADSAIVCGVGLLALQMAREGRTTEGEAAHD